MKLPSVPQLFLLCLLLCAAPQIVPAQSKQSLRYEIDAKRAGVGNTSREALPRGREFKRIDSTYYVGWLLEGGYKFEHAADLLGYRMAADQLQKALDLLDRDFRREVRTRTSDVFEYIRVMKYQRDWDFLAYALMQCYSNTEEPDKLWALLQRCKKVDLQLEAFIETYNYMAWTVHRNRFYTSSKYAFLKNSIEENERYANQLLDSSIRKIRRDAELNRTIFQLDYEKEKMPGVWHDKSILHTYNLNIPSGAHYYEKLRSTPYFPHNNFATFCMIQGKFAEAREEYRLSKNDEPGDKRLRESYYYSSVLNEYSNDNEKGIAELKDLIKANGSTPGYGWYQIALARNLLYDGQLIPARRHALRASQFKEIHIGTTLGQSHYDFSVALLDLMLKMREIEQVRFLNKNWWYSPEDLGRIARLTMEKYGLQFMIINQFASNPERDRVIYKLFSTESTVSWDEIWHLIDGFSVRFFLEKFRKEAEADARPQVRRYYRLLVGRLLLKEDEPREALRWLQQALNDPGIDSENEKLFKARCIESILLARRALDEHSDEQASLEQWYALYPQMMPYSGQMPRMRLQAKAGNSAEQAVLEALWKTSIPWTDKPGESALVADIRFERKGQFPMIRFSVKKGSTVLLSERVMTMEEPVKTARQLAFHLFGTGNDDRPLTKKED
jgi:hypothetical protein